MRQGRERERDDGYTPLNLAGCDTIRCWIISKFEIKIQLKGPRKSGGNLCA